MGDLVETKRTATADALLRMPDDGFRYELVRGELRRLTPAGSRHGAVAMCLGASLRAHVAARGLGVVFAAETGFRLASDPDTVRAPDVAFVRRERVERQGLPAGYFPGAPDLVAEVVSPGDTFTEVHAKACDWLDAGARLVLIVDPHERAVTRLRSREEVEILGEDATLDGADVVAGWSVRVRDLFAL